MTSYAAVLQNTLKFSLEPSALALDTLHFSLKRREKNAKNFVDLLYGAPKTCRLFKVSVILPPSGKISAGAHGDIAYSIQNLIVFFCRYKLQNN